MLEHLGSIWNLPDEGLWEVRADRRQFTYSKVMAWVAFDRGIRAAETYGFEGPIDRWRRTRQAIHEDVRTRIRPRDKLRQSHGRRHDASLLPFRPSGFFLRTMRVRGTVDAVERRLFVDGFLRRYDPATTDDGLPGHEGVLACAFWLADVRSPGPHRRRAAVVRAIA
jgi:GH15 family glucan-1,4-alpha-glucosidase